MKLVMLAVPLWYLEVLTESFSCEHVFISDEYSITFPAYRLTAQVF